MRRRSREQRNGEDKPMHFHKIIFL